MNNFGVTTIRILKMTDNNHPITPPPELVQEWREEAAHRQYSVSETEDHLIEQAAQYSADQELEACITWLLLNGWGQAIDGLRADRRPKPPSLKAQALKALQRTGERWRPIPDDCDIIRRALEQLND